MRASAPFVVVDLGDMDRWKRKGGSLLRPATAATRRTALESADGFLRELLSTADLSKGVDFSR